MLNSKRLLVILVIVLSLLVSVVVFADEMISVSGDWQGSIFGNVGGQDKITEENFEIREDTDGSVKLRSSNNRGKIESSSEGIAYYFKELPAEANFELRARAVVESFDMNNQVSFGLMIRDKVLYNENNKEDIGYCLAVGPLDVTKDSPRTGFYRTGEGQSKIGEMVNEAVPAVGNTYDLSIKKLGNTYVSQFGNEEPVVLEDFKGFEGNTIYVGLYTARNATITFSDINIDIDRREVEKLEVDTTAMKTDYLLEEVLDLRGLQVKAIFFDGSEELLSTGDYIVSGFDSSSIGTNSLTINYNGVTAVVDLQINFLTCTGLRIKYYPAKTDYYIENSFDPQGLVITADYNDGYKVEELKTNQYNLYIDGNSVDSEYILDSGGRKKVIVESRENPVVTAEFYINVLDGEISELKIIKQPEKTVYFIGDELELDGLSVYAKYSDGTQLRLMKDEYLVSDFISESPGVNEVVITHKGRETVLSLIVKEKELTGIELSKYPVTTYYIGEEFSSKGLEVAKVYDNNEKEILAESKYEIVSTAFDNTIPGVYDIKIVPEDSSQVEARYKVTVREKIESEWNYIKFGQSAKDDDNFVQLKDNGSIEIASVNGSGKVATDHDGISFYYTEIDAERDNFVLSADIKVIEYAKDPHDGQEAFGIMARDAIGEDGDTSVFASNIVGVGGFSGGTKDPIGTQLFMRTGVESADGAGSNGTSSIMIKEEKPVLDNSYPAKEYRLTLAKTNSGYIGRLNDGEEVILFEPDLLNLQDSKVYLGFFAARVAHIEVSNIDFRVSAVETDAPKVAAPEEAVTPVFEVISLEKTSSKDYRLIVESNVDGTVSIKQNQQLIVRDEPIEGEKELSVLTTIPENTDTDFSLVFLPTDTQYLSSYDKIVRNFTVEMKTFQENGDIYVSPEGSSDGTGSLENPLDLDTAVSFVSEGQRIILFDGRHLRNSKLEIRKYNDGTPEAMKYLVAAEGAKPVIDFEKKSEGVILSGNYWHVKGIDFARSAPNEKGFVVGGSYNIIEECRFYENGDTGLQISRTDITEDDKSKWPSHNLILNSTSFDNRDPSDNNADGFAAKLTSGEGNLFRGCIAHNNIDDGWDLYTKVGTGAIGPVIIENSIAYHNGKLSDDTVGNGDKNGFKLGGEGVHVPHIVRNSIAFANGAVGFTSNSNPGVIAINNIALNNMGGNLDFSTYTGINTDFKIDGFISISTIDIPADSYPEELKSDKNFMFNGRVTENKSGSRITEDNFVKLIPQLPFERDVTGSIIIDEFLKLIPVD